MPRILGRDDSPDLLRALTGTLSQLAGVRSVVLAEGKGRGLRAAEVWTGSGLRFHVVLGLLDRTRPPAAGCDGAEAAQGPWTRLGAPNTGDGPLASVHAALGTSAQYDQRGREWLRTFGGGLLGLRLLSPGEEVRYRVEVGALGTGRPSAPSRRGRAGSDRMCRP